MDDCLLQLRHFFAQPRAQFLPVLCDLDRKPLKVGLQHSDSIGEEDRRRRGRCEHAKTTSRTGLGACGWPARQGTGAEGDERIGVRRELREKVRALDVG